MSQDIDSEGDIDRAKVHLTTRRGFVTVLGFGVVSLYGMWAAYGAAPTSLSFLAAGEGGGHGGGGGLSPEAFRRLAEDFIEANSLPDGSVKPVRRKMAGMPAAANHETADGHGMSVMAEKGHDQDGGGHEEDDRHRMPGMAPKEHDEHGGGHQEADRHGLPAMVAKPHDEPDAGPIDVYLLASRYGYDPSILRLETKVPYRFRIMAFDGNHGASIFLRLAGHMIRCPAKVLVEKQIMFTRPDEYLVYCTVYCGEGHDMMMGKIVVT